jgi:hypothetical protein
VKTDRGSLRLAVISGDDAHHNYLVRLLAERGFDVVLWLVEPAAEMRRRLWRQRRLRDWAAAVYHRWRRSLFGLDAYRRRAFPPSETPPDVPRVEVDWVNGPSARRALEEAAPGTTVIIGCGILRPETLALCGNPVLNVHGGHLPEYRGNHCIFFALAEGERDKVGATLHYVDAGIDTGDIIEVAVVSSGPLDSAETLYCRAEHEAFRRLCAHLDELAAGIEPPRHPQRERGRIFRTRDRTPWLDVRRYSLWRLPRDASAGESSLLETRATSQGSGNSPD